MYLCPNCMTPYTQPREAVERADLTGEGMFEVRRELACPLCGYPADPAADAADACGCGQWKNRADPLCRDCHKALIVKFTAFADGLTAEEEADLDNLLDGVSVTARRTWR